MSVKIYHNPRCSKSRQTLEILQSYNIDFQIIEYLKTPLNYDQLVDLMNALGFLDPTDMIRKNESSYKDLSLQNKDSLFLLEAMTKNPILLERPIVSTQKGTKICRPPELVKDLL